MFSCLCVCVSLCTWAISTCSSTILRAPSINCSNPDKRSSRPFTSFMLGLSMVDNSVEISVDRDSRSSQSYWHTDVDTQTDIQTHKQLILHLQTAEHHPYHTTGDETDKWRHMTGDERQIGGDTRQGTRQIGGDTDVNCSQSVSCFTLNTSSLQVLLHSPVGCVG